MEEKIIAVEPGGIHTDGGKTYPPMYLKINGYTVPTMDSYYDQLRRASGSNYRARRIAVAGVAFGVLGSALGIISLLLQLCLR